MKILDKWKMSEWAYWQCKLGNNIEAIRELITLPKWAYNYCLNIEDLKEMRDIICKDDYWILRYCERIKDTEEMSSKIKSGFHRAQYERYVRRKRVPI